jgi:UDP-N-acetylglucosamine 4,6-dehydratase
MFSGKTLFISGGTGTFGNAVLRKVLQTDIKEIRIFSRDEKKQDDMRRHIGEPRVRFFLGDVREPDTIVPAMVGVDYVFHAAALKQVPSCEFFPLQAIRTNALGTENILNSALACNVKTCIVLSTDKAVYPVNAMGMSKALMEKLMIAKARLADSATVFCGTRYGNVMASRGSVIPLFIQQIVSNEPLTVTDPNMTRFMMTIQDAVDLVLYAFDHGNPGDIFVQKSSAVTMETLARSMLALFGSSNGIRIIGTRHGEKLYETLLTREERVKAQDCGDYYRVPADGRDLNYASYFSEGDAAISHVDEYNSHNTKRLNVDETIEMLGKLALVREALVRGRVAVDELA